MTATAPSSQDPEPGIVFGRFMLPDLSEQPCQAVGLSPDGATFLCARSPSSGQPIVAYLDDLGRVEGVSAEAIAGGFKVAFAHSGARRERFAARLGWLADKGADADQRRHARHEPREAKSHITLPDGRVYPCEVLDISLSGAGVKVDVLPSLGTYVTLGKMRGRIVRYLDAGIAIEFVKPLDRAQLSEQVR